MRNPFKKKEEPQVAPWSIHITPVVDETGELTIRSEHTYIPLGEALKVLRVVVEDYDRILQEDQKEKEDA